MTGTELLLLLAVALPAVMAIGFAVHPLWLVTYATVDAVSRFFDRIGRKLWQAF